MSACYVAVGDSMSIDDYAGGPGCGAASLLLRNRDVDLPDWAERGLSSVLPGIAALLLARDADNPELWYCGVVEPNAYGAHAIRACWWYAMFG